jgi:XTP/dITP diphosphohydrolase
LGNDFVVKGLKDIGCDVDVPETANTFEGNALQKAQFVYEHYKVPCFSDDTGLEIEALNGEPGVYSARYAGEEKNSEKNMQKVLEKLQGVTNRQAQFRTVIAYVDGKNNYFFEGIVRGTILDHKRGDKGFGYDPIFVPEGRTETFAELDMAVKNSMSHRGRAMEKFIAFFNQNLKK